MKSRIVLAAAIALFISACTEKKSENPKPQNNTSAVQAKKLENLAVVSEFSLLPYTQAFEKKEGSLYYSLTENKATFQYQLSTDFDGTTSSDKQEVNSIPDSTKEEYARIMLLNEKTIHHQYKSIIQGEPLVTDLKLPITFKKGTYKEYLEGKEVIVEHTAEGLKKLTKEFSWQMLRELTPEAMKIITDFGYNTITNKGKEPEEAKKFDFKDSYEIVRKEVPSPVITFKENSCSIAYKDSTFFTIEFKGSFIAK